MDVCVSIIDSIRAHDITGIARCLDLGPLGDVPWPVGQLRAGAQLHAAHIIIGSIWMAS